MKRTEISLILTVALAFAACGPSQSANPAQSPTSQGSRDSNSTQTGTTPPSAFAPSPSASPETPPRVPSSTDTPPAGSSPAATAPPSRSTPAAAAPPPGTPTPSSTPSAPAPPSALRVYSDVAVPTGTRLSLEVLTSHSSQSSTVESPVRARLTRDVEVNGVVALPSGSVLTGIVTEAVRAGRVKGRSRLAFRFTQADVRGTTERLRTNPVVLLGEESTKDDATKIGGGAVVGAAIGGILGGGKGAAQGAAIGGGAGTGVVLATRGQEVSIGAGTSVTATLAEPLTLQVPR